MEALNNEGILFGVSITVTSANYQEVTESDFTGALAKSGCKAVIFVEYVPVGKETDDLAPDDHIRDYMEMKLKSLRSTNEDMLHISFPGDEKSSGGCLAAGRGFFHINTNGGVEPCPFSPYSDINLRNHTLLEAMESPLFVRLRDEGILLKEHTGGCVLFEQEAKVKSLL